MVTHIQLSSAAIHFIRRNHTGGYCSLHPCRACESPVRALYDDVVARRTDAVRPADGAAPVRQATQGAIR
ncbi:hypothetical protein FAGKG844_700005 [Frankia sp. AgKG'84/4]